MDQDSIDKVINEIKSKLTGTYGDVVDNLNMRDLRLAYYISLGSTSGMSWEHLHATLELAKKQFISADLAAKNFSDATSNFAKGLASLRSVEKALSGILKQKMKK